MIDLRTVAPLDRETILTSVRKTHHAAVLHEAARIGGVGAEIGMMIQEEALPALRTFDMIRRASSNCRRE